ncbi:LPXTG cell wall anchor domain-containing protein [Nocardioides sp. Soil805]|uniref:LPXTG cell wall anchor domain-containing protein n=1 Tax=Nocardioides sp. Soil805 TaxID=1736416 RepID=UPI000703AF03|nr:LPXTG cell wall anchor domain-containing protein [Nocardioides sp. Soil805]KRF36175.1 hypothetical protein ASG94_01450 [Nocardioides sp. Soil805]
MRRLVAATALGLLGLLATVLPAAAADEQLELSRDGRSWSHTLGGGVLDAGVRWVPGDTRVVAFHVRNGGETSADFSLAVLSDDPDGLLGHGLVTIHARLDDQAWTAVEDLDTDYRLSTEDLPVDGSARVEVRLAFTDAGNEAQDLVLPVDFRLRLTDATVRQDDGTEDGTTEGGATGGGSTGGGSTTPDGVLPATGAPEVRASLLGAAALIGAGLALVLARRRREGDVDGTWHATA